MGKVMERGDAEGRRPRGRQAGQRDGPRAPRRVSDPARWPPTAHPGQHGRGGAAGSEDSVLRELEGRLGCDLFLRGNVLTLDGDDADVSRAATMVDELVG